MPSTALVFINFYSYFYKFWYQIGIILTENYHNLLKEN